MHWEKLRNDSLFDGYYDIPFIPKQHFDLVIDKLIAYDKTYKHIYEPGEVAHFYLDDQKLMALKVFGTDYQIMKIIKEVLI